MPCFFRSLKKYLQTCPVLEKELLQKFMSLVQNVKDILQV